MNFDYDPFSSETRDDPYPAYAQLRQKAPVHWAEASGVYCIARHDDVSAVLRSTDEFSSDAMRTMLMGVRPGSDPLADPAMLQRMLKFADALPFPPQDLLTARNLISEDPPRHGVMRAIVNRGFTPRRISIWEARMRTIVAECLVALRGADRFDLAESVSIPLPVRIIAEILGVEPERRADFKRWSDQLIAGSTGSKRGLDPSESGVGAALGELSEYVSVIARDRAKAPGDDLVSLLVAAQEGEARLSDVEVTLFVFLLLGAGNETTTNLIGNGVMALLRHPEQLARLHADRTLLPGAIEEMLRFDSPVQFVFRRATRDVVLSDVRIPAGSIVTALVGSANRDEAQWGPTAGAFEVDRNPQGHLGFGFGNHFCLGASLARLEARVVFEALLGELPKLRLRGDPIEYVDSFLVRGPRRLALERIA